MQGLSQTRKLIEEIDNLIMREKWETWEWFNCEYYIPYGISKEYYYDFLRNEFYGDSIPKIGLRP